MQYLHFCNGCGVMYSSDREEPEATYETGDPEVGMLEFCTEECRDKWVATPPDPVH
jgi:hypothetical protein